MIKELIEHFISATFISGVLIYLGKHISVKLLDSVVETYKHKLTINLEEFKRKQQQALQEYSIRHSKLHQDRSEIIKILYKKIVHLESKVERYVNWSNNIKLYMNDNIIITDDIKEQGVTYYKESIEVLSDDVICEFMEYVKENEIFFSDELMVLLEHFIISLRKISSLRSIAKMSLERKFMYEGSEINVLEDDKWAERLLKIHSEIQNVKKEIRNEFKSLLGVIGS